MLWVTHRGVLALDAGAVEAQGGDAGGAAGDVEDALVVALPRLRLRQVLGRQGDGLHHAHGDVDLGGGQDLRAVLQGERGAEMKWESCTASPSSGTPPWAGRAVRCQNAPTGTPSKSPCAPNPKRAPRGCSGLNTEKETGEEPCGTELGALGQNGCNKTGFDAGIAVSRFQGKHPLGTHRQASLSDITQPPLPFLHEGTDKAFPLPLCNTTQSVLLPFQTAASSKQPHPKQPDHGGPKNQHRQQGDDDDYEPGRKARAGSGPSSPGKEPSRGQSEALGF